MSWFDHFRTPEWRPYRALMFVGLGLSGIIPILHGLSMYGFRALNERMGLVWVMLEGAMYIFGAFLYAVSHSIMPMSHQRFPLANLYVGSIPREGVSGHI